MRQMRFTVVRLRLEPVTSAPDSEQQCFLQFDPARERLVATEVGRTGAGDPILYVTLAEELPAAEAGLRLVPTVGAEDESTPEGKIEAVL
jgi:hypothetical protein